LTLALSQSPSEKCHRGEGFDAGRLANPAKALAVHFAQVDLTLQQLKKKQNVKFIIAMFIAPTLANRSKVGANWMQCEHQGAAMGKKVVFSDYRLTVKVD
jgi:hypothetical protein